MSTSRLAAAVSLALLGASGCKTGVTRSQIPAVDLATAVASAVAERPGRAVEAKVKTKDGVVAFEVDVLGQDGLVSEVELGADGKPAAALPWKKADTPKAKPELAAIAPTLAVDLATAIRTALQATPGTARSAELSTSHGAAQWKVKLRDVGGQESEVRVDAATGQVIP